MKKGIDVKLFRGACGSKSIGAIVVLQKCKVKLFRGACGSKYVYWDASDGTNWSSSFAELVDLNFECLNNYIRIIPSSSFAELVDLSLRTELRSY